MYLCFSLKIKSSILMMLNNLPILSMKYQTFYFILVRGKNRL
jgi:hypothetical protein